MMIIKKHKIYVSILLLFVSPSSYAHSKYSESYLIANYCIERLTPFFRPSQSCPGQIIPTHKTRNFLGEELKCSEANHLNTRLPYPFNEESWLDLKSVSRHDAAQVLRQQPSPRWRGELIYKTYVHWAWEDCQQIKNAKICGTYQVCEQKEMITESGKTKWEQHCHSHPKTCFSDVTIYESMHCGHGIMDFDIEFLKKNETQWNPDTPDFIDRLANGYDLLPGEEEAVTVSNLKNSWLESPSTQLSPTVLIEDPKNDYKLSQTVHNQSNESLTCRFNGYDKVSFMVDTKKRIASRSPNAFSLPTSFDNEAIEPLVWQSAMGKDGSRKEKGFPMLMRAQDYSAAAMNEVSQDVSDKLKSMIIRVQLYEPSIFGGERLKSTIYIDEAKGIQQTLNAISSDQTIRRSTLWEFKLKNGDDPRKNMYRSYVPALVYYPGKILLPDKILSYDDHLTPGTEYTLKLTVYQKNLPFYHQPCESDPDARDCKWYTLWGLFSSNRYEDNYFSKKSLDVKFTSNPDIDQRTWLSTFWHAVWWAQVILPIGVISSLFL